MNTRLIAAAEAVMVAAVMLAAGCGSAAASAPTPTPSPTHSVMSPAASSTSPSPFTSPSPSHSAPPPTPLTLSATTFPVAALLASCYPTTPSGGCYQPGQYCSTSDYGATGVAGDGTTDHLSRQQRLAVGTGLRHDPQRQPAPLRGPGHRRRRHGRVPGRPAARARCGAAAGRRREPGLPQAAHQETLTRAAGDERYQELTSAGYQGRQRVHAGSAYPAGGRGR